MKTKILSFIILAPIVILFVELTELQIDFRSYLFGLCVMMLYVIIEMIVSDKIESKSKTKSAEDIAKEFNVPTQKENKCTGI